MNNNRILAALPDRVYNSLLPYLKMVEFVKGQVLYESGEPIQQVYFPTNSIISLLNTTEEGWSVQLALIGKEGILGIAGLLEPKTTSYRAVVQISGSALEMNVDVLKRAYHSHHSVKRLLQLHLHSLLTQITQWATCNRFHSAEERLAHLLLSIQDRMKTKDLPFTQEHISLMLGSRRPTVTISARNLQRAGLINCTRGRVSILNREGLESVTCECYRIIKKEFDYLFHTFVS